MANDIVRLKVITPQGVVCEEEISSVKLPASDGQIGILPMHERYVGMLGIGVIEYDSLEDKKTKKMVLSQGFCNVEDNTLIILADKVIRPESIKNEDLVSERETIKMVLPNCAPESSEWKLATSRLKELEAVEACLAELSSVPPSSVQKHQH